MRKSPSYMYETERTYGECAVTEDLLLEVGTVVDYCVAISNGPQKPFNNVVSLLEVPLAISGRAVSARNTLFQLVGVLLVVLPRLWPAVGRGKVRIRWVPVETVRVGQPAVRRLVTYRLSRCLPSIDSGTSAKQASGEYVNVLAPPERIAVLEHSFCYDSASRYSGGSGEALPNNPGTSNFVYYNQRLSGLFSSNDPVGYRRTFVPLSQSGW